MKGVLVGKALGVRGFANSSAFLEKLVHPARSGQPLLQLAHFLQEVGRNNAIQWDLFLPALLPGHTFGW